jgi:hypothetical protein
VSSHFRFTITLFVVVEVETSSQTLIAQVHRDQKVQCLWETAADMLAFLKDAKPVLNDTLALIVSDMMKQIYHCAIFVREYGSSVSVF